MQSNTSKMPANQSPIPLHAISANTLKKIRRINVMMAMFIAYRVYKSVHIFMSYSLWKLFCYSKVRSHYQFKLKVHKIEIFFGFDFEICIISLLFMSKY
jgi:hypothetical protein